MFRRFILGWFLILFAVLPALNAQHAVSLWRTVLPVETLDGGRVVGPSAISCATIDTAGNLYLGSSILTTPTLIKIDTNGVVVWQFACTNTVGSVECLAVSTNGPCYLTAQSTNDDIFHVTLIAVSHDGEELWRKIENVTSQFTPYYTGHALAAGPGNSVYLLGRLTEFPDPDTIDTFVNHLSLRRISCQGNQMWCVSFPGDTFSIGSGGLSRCMTVDDQGCAYVAAGTYVSPLDFTYSQFTAAVDANGCILWSASTNGSPLSSIVISSSGTVCAAGETGYTVLHAADGKIIFQRDKTQSCIASATFADGSFLVSEDSGYMFSKVDALTGDVAWRSFSDFISTTLDTPGNPVVPWPDNSMITVGQDAYFQSSLHDLLISQLNNKGISTWFQFDSISRTLQTLPFGSGGLRTWLFKASDNTIRVIINLTRSGSLTSLAAGPIESFAITNTCSSLTLSSATSGARWDGTNDVNLSSAWNSNTPIHFQWYNLNGPIDYGTNACLRLSNSQFPDARGFYWITATNDSDLAMSPLIYVTLDGIRLRISSPDSNGNRSLMVFSDILESFQVESTTNLVDWVPVPNSNWYIPPGDSLSIRDQPNTIFRARRLP